MLLKRVDIFNMTLIDLYHVLKAQDISTITIPKDNGSALICKIRKDDISYSNIVDTIRAELPIDINPWNHRGNHLSIVWYNRTGFMVIR